MRNSTRMLVWTTMTAMVATSIAALHDSDYCEILPDVLDPPPHPNVPDRYTCTMEVIGHDEDTNVSFEMNVEEVYDGPGNLVSTVIASSASTQQYILDWNTGQMHYIVRSKHGVDERECTTRPLSEGVAFFPPVWGSGQNLSLAHIVGPGTLLGILNWTDTHYKGQFPIRGMTADRWDWCGLKDLEQTSGNVNVSMATYWTSPEWNMPEPSSVESSVPLGWEVEMRNPGSGAVTQHLVHNIMHFRPMVLDVETFMIPGDVFCSGMKYTEPFPDYDKEKLFTFSMEMRQTSANEFTWADGWYDFEKQLYRIDHEVGTREPVTTSEIFDFNDGIAFTVIKDTFECKLSIINDTRTDWSDITGISHLWGDSPNAFFGSDRYNYTYYGTRFERSIRGDEWRAVRNDWPPDVTGGNNNMIWQWTFSSKNVTHITSMGEQVFLEKQVPIGLRVTAQHDFETSHGRVPKGSSFVYHMYNFDLESDAREDLYTDAGAFDVYACYSANWRDHLKYKLDASSWPEVLDTPLMTSSKLSEYWQFLLARVGTVSTIRITRVKVVVEGSEAWVEFVLLYRHPMIGQLDHDLYVSLTPGQVAKSNIGQAINSGSIYFEGKRPDGESFRLEAVKGSLAVVVEHDCTTTTTQPPTKPSTNHYTGPPTTSTTPTTTTTTSTKPDESTLTPKVTPSSSTEVSTQPYIPPEGAIYTSGDLAGLGVGMLVLGLAVGAGITFLVLVKKIHLTVIAWFKK